MENLALLKMAIESIHKILLELDTRYVFPDKAKVEMNKIEDIFAGLMVHQLNTKYNKSKSIIEFEDGTIRERNI